MNDIEEATLKKTIEQLLKAMNELQEGQHLLTNAVIQTGQRLDRLEKPPKYKPKLVGLNGKEITS